jgi:hypothetical protein
MEGQELIGKSFANKSAWASKGYRKTVKIVAFDNVERIYYAQDERDGSIHKLNEIGEGKWYECGGVWLRIDLKEPL